MTWKLARPQSNWKCLELLKKQSPREETKQYQQSAGGGKKTLGNPGLNLLRLPCWFHAQKASNGHQFKGRDDKILIQCGIKDVNCKIFSFEFFVKIFSQCKDFFCRHCNCQVHDIFPRFAWWLKFHEERLCEKTNIVYVSRYPHFFPLNHFITK